LAAKPDVSANTFHYISVRCACGGYIAAGRVCSSYASGLATAEKLLSGRVLDDEEMELELGDENLDFVDEEVRQLQAIIDVLT
jgi:hypothetical protein